MPVESCFSQAHGPSSEPQQGSHDSHCVEGQIFKDRRYLGVQGILHEIQESADLDRIFRASAPKGFEARILAGEDVKGK
jgi:hypothetical protein